jgi:transposase InsO family protein
LATPIPVQRLCALTAVSRAGFYRWRSAEPGADADVDLRDEIQRIAVEWPCYGWRRVTAELWRRGWMVNHKRVRRMLREDNLLCLRRRKFVVTTDSDHGCPVYPNLAVVLDAYSRRVIGWALERTLADDLPLAALRMALRFRSPAPGLVHHSDRGIQYASQDYTGLLREHTIRISMSRKGNPYDNATCESFMKTLKYEEVYRQEYRDLAEARASIEQFIEKVYNQKRLHSALGYRPPVEFEQALSMAAEVRA